MKKQNGITLIALVITIIVLLLLAGVTISLTVGKNGILTQATKAVKDTKEATDTEEIELAWTSVESDYWTAWSKNTSLTREEYFTIENFSKYLEDRGTIDADTFNFDGNTGVTSFKYTSIVNPGKDYLVQIDQYGIVSLNKFGAMVTAANYGDKVNYVAKNGYSDWKIFYSTGANVFLIATDYIEKTLVPSVMNAVGSNAYAVSWSSAPTALSARARQDALFGRTESSYTLNSSYENSRCVSTLLDTANWTEFKDTKGYGQYAIGSPTIEMWISSWNAKGEKYNESGNTKYETLNSGKGSYGYSVGSTSLTYYYLIKTKSQVGYNDTLYFPHQSKYENITGYFLAAPSMYTNEHILRICYDSYIRSNVYNHDTTAVRPVVALSSEVTATQDENGVWQLSK